jgi:hypothetical protein
VKRAASVLLLVWCVGLLPAPARSQSDTTAAIAGTVRSSISGLPIPDVTVALRDVRKLGVSDSTGAFAVAGLPAGRRTVRVVYDTLSYDQELTLEPGKTLRLSVLLDVEALELTPIIVDAQSSLAERSLAGFFDRRQHGFGQFYTIVDLERLHPVSPQMLLTQSGVTVRCRARSCLPLVRQDARVCVMSVFLNGMRMGSDNLELVRVEQLAGVEVYLHALDVPRRFRTGLGLEECGAVLFWTRR